MGGWEVTQRIRINRPASRLCFNRLQEYTFGTSPTFETRCSDHSTFWGHYTGIFLFLLGKFWKPFFQWLCLPHQTLVSHRSPGLWRGIGDWSGSGRGRPLLKNYPPMCCREGQSWFCTWFINYLLGLLGVVQRPSLIAMVVHHYSQSWFPYHSGPPDQGSYLMFRIQRYSLALKIHLALSYGTYQS